MACGSAHTIAWSTTKPTNAGRLPTEVPMEFNHLQMIPLGSLRNRLMLLHNFSELVCSSLPMFDLQPRVKEHDGQDPLVALDALRGVLIPSGKVTTGIIDFIVLTKEALKCWPRLVKRCKSLILMRFTKGIGNYMFCGIMFCFRYITSCFRIGELTTISRMNNVHFRNWLI